MNTVPHPGAPRKKPATAALPSDELAARADSDLRDLVVQLTLAVAGLAERVRQLELVNAGRVEIKIGRPPSAAPIVRPRPRRKK